jgi:hypothetical protein
MQAPAKLAIVVLAIIMLLPSLCFAGAELDGYRLWQERISELRIKYGDKLKCNNCIYVLLRYKPYPEGGPSWRIRDASTSARLKSHNQYVRAFDKRLEATCSDYMRPRCTNNERGFFVRGRDFLGRYLPQQGVKEALPAQALTILEKIGKSCGQYGCDNQVIFMLWPDIGVVSLREPRSASDPSLCINYYFLIPLPAAAKLRALLR